MLGKIQYQNSVTPNNTIFYQIVDSFYTNYWWSSQILKKQSLSFLPNKTIYVGNDVWGRGTFGDGQYNLYKAIDQIERQNKSLFGIALFGTGYTYQKANKGDALAWKHNEDRLYRGTIDEVTKVQSWQQIDQNFKTFIDLDNSYKWFIRHIKQNISIYQKEKLIRIQFSYKFNQNISSDSKVNYKIQLVVHDPKTGKVYGTELKQIQNRQVSQKSVKKVSFVIESLHFTYSTQLNIFCYSSIQNLTSDQKITIKHYHIELDWISQVPYERISLSESYCSYLNIGFGSYFYFQGNPVYKNYDYLSDYDFPHTMSINHPLLTDFQYEDSYVGGSSMIIQQGQMKLIAVNITNIMQFKALTIVNKHGQIKNVKIWQQGNDVSFQLRQSKILNNSWAQDIYAFNDQQISKIFNQFKLELATFIILNVKKRILVGKIIIQTKQKKQPLKHLQRMNVQKPRFQLFIYQSYKSMQKDMAYLNFQIIHEHGQITSEKFVATSKRYILLIENFFSCFIYVQGQQQRSLGKVDQISFKKDIKKMKIYVYHIDGQQQKHQVLMQYELNLQQLMTQKLGYKIHVKNY